MDNSNGSESKVDNRPSAADFDLYLPWACKQLQLETTVQVTRIYQNEYVSAVMTDRSKKGKTKSKMGQSRIDIATDQEKVENSASILAMKQIFDRRCAEIVKIQAIYDSHDNLVHIKLDKNINLPRIMIKVIGLIMQFQTHLNTITINGGLDHYTIYEICHFLPTTYITDLCLDDCHLKQPNYHLLLEAENFLKYLSLCRCKIDDAIVEVLCSYLIYPLPASKTLSVLYLSSNIITDEGAKSLADVLRSNRQLSYLNLASNMITDEGAIAIFNVLIEFPLTVEEIITSKIRYMTYLKNKNDMIILAIRDLRVGDVDRKASKRKSVRPANPASLKKVKPDASQKSLVDPIKCLTDVDTALIEKAVAMVENALGEFVDPYSNYNTLTRNGVTYCRGNNFLCCLNISYNYLSYLLLRKIQSVLLYQKLEDRTPRGLLTVSVEGNCVPIICKELSQIDSILEHNLLTHFRKLSASKKRPHSKSVR